MSLSNEVPNPSAHEYHGRSRGHHALVRGEWFDEVLTSGPDQTVRLLATPAQIEALPWVAELVGNRGAFEVPCDDVERSVHVKPLCTYQGGGPFEISVVKDAEGVVVREWVSADSPGYTALIYYAGDDRAWAEKLEGVEVYDAHSAWGDCVLAWVSLSELSDFRELVKDFPIPGRSEGVS